MLAAIEEQSLLFDSSVLYYTCTISLSESCPASILLVLLILILLLHLLHFLLRRLLLLCLLLLILNLILLLYLLYLHHHPLLLRMVLYSSLCSLLSGDRAERPCVTSDAELRNTVGHPATDEVTDNTIM